MFKLNILLASLSVFSCLADFNPHHHSDYHGSSQYQDRNRRRPSTDYINQYNSRPSQQDYNNRYNSRPSQPDYNNQHNSQPSQPDYNSRPPPNQNHEPGAFVFEEQYDRNRPSQGSNTYQSSQSTRGLEVLSSWKQIDFDFPNDDMREELIRKGDFIQKNILILDVEIFGRGANRKVFVTLPRVRPGVPVTIASVTSKKRRGVNLLAPFPDWNSNYPQNCERGLTSIFRTHIDTCGRMWLLDTGNNNAFAGPSSRIVCPPSVLIYDLNNNNKLLGKYQIPQSMIADTSLLVTIVVDTRRSDCSDAYAYIADALGYKMLVFNLRTQQFWRINSIHFFPYPDKSQFNINGVTFSLMGGIFGLALGPVYRNKRYLYFHCIDSVRQSWVDTDDLRNQSLWQNNMNAAPRAFNLFNGTRSSQSAAAAMNDDGIMFFGLIGSNEIACWNSQTKFNKRNIHILAKDDRNLQFISGMKVQGDKLYVASNRLQLYLNNQIPEQEENYRVVVADLGTLTRGTPCQVESLKNRIDTDYTPDSESVPFPDEDQLTFAR